MRGVIRVLQIGNEIAVLIGNHFLGEAVECPVFRPRRHVLHLNDIDRQERACLRNSR